MQYFQVHKKKFSFNFMRQINLKAEKQTAFLNSNQPF